MDPQPTVGIVTRTKDRAVLLRRALESILHQTYPHWRMVIVNDGGDPAAVESLVGHYAAEAAGRIRIIHNPKSMGMEGASKIGIDVALDLGDLLIFHDDDDSWAPEFLSVAVHELLRVQKKFPDTQGVTTYAHLVREAVRGNLIEILSVEAFSGWVPRGFLSLDRMLAGNFIPPISFLFTKKAYIDAGNLYELIPYLGDWDFLIRVLSRYDVYMVPQYLAFYHWRQSTEPGSVNNSVTAELDQHHFYKQYLLNRWLRQDIAAGRFGVGAYANLRHHVETLLNKKPEPAAPPPPPPPPPPDPSERVPPGLPQEMVDYYWESASWKALKPFRFFANKLLGLPGEKRPSADNIQLAWQAARDYQGSLSWNLMAPLRVAQSVFGVLGRMFGRGK